ncbi:claspin [Drosophila grimshawi]|uniref:GH16024 n=1 Tax=Drosophila grimshawi TaxID=7222 RepID=B4J2Q2_DROGR|nr:claspin [Drosophila grimshawi]EDV96043.1 GH16024 [Drosophila grimshawi]
MSESARKSATAAECGEKEDDESMEKLHIDDEDEKNVSAEDILGGKTLIMSDSENEEEMPAESASAGKQIAPKNRTQTLLDSDQEDEDDDQQAKTEVKMAVASKPRKKISAIIDSDSEQEEEQDEKTGREEEKKEYSETEEEEYKSKPKKKISAIIDTDSEDDEEKKQEMEANLKKKVKKQEKKMKKTQRLESSSEESSEDEKPNDTGREQNKLKGIVDSESESEEHSLTVDKGTTDPSTDKPNISVPKRASAKKALDGIQALQSEQQRLHREAHISVPYHQPKPRTLKEFLGRRTINRPLAMALAGGSPMPNKKESQRSLGLRMTSEELQAYAKLMDERAKEATEFFKSESEHDEDSGEENTTEEPEEPREPTKVMQEVVEDSLDLPEAEPTIEIDMASTKDESAQEIEPITELVSPSKAMLVTEVVELPKLDLSALNITPPSKPTTPRISEAIRRLRDEKSSDMSPSLKGDANMVIDLETGDMFAKKTTGVDDLLQRLMKTREAKKHKTTDTVNILSTAHGKLELSKVSIHLHEDEPVNKEQKPGAAFIKMQEDLKTLINKKRMDELRKKQADEMEAEAAEDEDMDVDEEYEPDDKPCKSQVIINEDEEIVDREIDENAGEDNESEGEINEACEAELEADSAGEAEEAEADSSSDSEQESEPEPDNTQTGKRKNRIIRAFQDDNSDEDDDVDLLQTPKPSKVAPMTATQLQLSAHKLFDTEMERTASDEENELLGLCSGRFTQSEVSSIAPTTIGALISQIPITQATPQTQAPDELEALCSGKFETQPEPETNKILSSDEEPPAEELETEKPRKKKLTKKRQKKKAKLGFSDDEESDEDADDLEDEEQLEGSELEEPAVEVPEAFVDYDSEENEIVVEMTKKDRKLRAANFVEKEAELSESEWGSADEDEKNMDAYDFELGDEDQFDREKLRHELGQIHARKMLDQDIREVRKIKDMLFEDDEGAVRQRQFRWKNAENDLGFSLDDSRLEKGDGEANEGSGDEENEHLWRKVRYEREQLLLEKGLKRETTGTASPLSPAVANSNTTGGTVRKLTIITAKKTTMEMKKNSPFLISKSVNSAQQQQQQRAVRGSFLVRDKETLNKLAGMTKGAAGDVDGTAGTVSVNTARAKNFVFATLTEEEHETQKRKAADLLNSSSETGVNLMKKPRLEPRRDKCLIDQLL